MASLLTDPLFEVSGRGPAPIQSFYHFSVTKSDVIWRWWKISPRIVDRYSKPGELKQSHEDFLDDTWLHSEVRMVFGLRILEYTTALCRGHYDYLEHLSDSLLLRIINYLELEDVGQLGRTSRRFRKLCGSEEFWEQAVHRHCNTVSAEVASLAVEVGWRTIFFTNKLQLQKLISRRRLKTKGQTPDSDTKEEESPGESLETNQAFCSEESDLDICSLKPGTGTGSGLDSSSRCDVDPDPGSEPQSGSDSSNSVTDQFLEGTRYQVETLTQSRVLSSGVGDYSTDPDKILS
ncbi:F-box only protein 36b [Astatotilapia calliptera]|uniref:F-box protein 36b n=2 Tax=Haplochromini TaxID=319058 RepID=A0A3P9BAE0_9CICH|nr:F-box only protein 36 [Maylandia zebra]XP_026005594.1 F-box only protein 36-like [Astatotilapia calliptera]